MAPYSAAGDWFQTATSTITKPVKELAAARRDLGSQLRRLNRALDTDLPELATFDKVLRNRFGIKTPLVVTSLRKTLIAIGYFYEPELPRADIYARMTAEELADVRKSLGFIRRSARFAQALIEHQLGLENPVLHSLPYTRDVQIDQRVKNLTAFGRLDKSSPAAGDANASRVLAMKDRYLKVLESIVAQTAEDNLKKVSQAKRDYLLATNKLKDITPLTLPVVPWVPDMAPDKSSTGRVLGGGSSPRDHTT